MKDKFYDMCKEALTHLSMPPFDASVKYFLSTGTINGGFYEALKKLKDMFVADSFLSEIESPSGADSSVLVKELENIINNYDHDEDAHKYNNLPACRVCSATKALAQYKSQPRSLHGGLDPINFLELARKEGLQWSELNSKWFIKGTFEYRTEEQLYELFKQEACASEHKSDREPEGIDIVKTENELLSKCLNMLRYLYMNEYCGEHGPEVFELIKAE